MDVKPKTNLQNPSPSTTFVLVHGAWHTGWCWHSVVERLEKVGHRVLAPDLPLSGPDNDREVLEAILDEAEEPIVLVGHSYGGVVISQAASARSDVRHLVYVCAFCERQDESLETYMQGEFATPLAVSLRVEEGQVVVDSTDAPSIFYGECAADVQEAAVARLRPMAAGELTERREPAWKSIPSTYVICERDAAVSPKAQEAMAQNTDRIERIATDHSPFLSTPDELVRILLRAAAK